LSLKNKREISAAYWAIHVAEDISTCYANVQISIVREGGGSCTIQKEDSYTENLKIRLSEKKGMRKLKWAPCITILIIQ